MSSSIAARRNALAVLARERELDAVLVTRAVNVTYLTGLDSSNAAVLVAAGGEAALATDNRYAGAARQICPDIDLIVTRNVAADLVARARERGARALGFEEHEVTVADHAALTEAEPEVELRWAKRPVERLRLVKDDDEIACLRRACELTDAAFAEVVDTIRPGRTEREIARALEAAMGRLGADGPAFDSIIAAGENGAVPHHRPANRPIAAGELVTMDFGACYRGYRADMTRTVAVGAPADWQREVYQLVADAARAGRRAAVPGAVTTDVDAAARQVIVDAGYGEQFTHGLGHGVGLEVHEDPYLGRPRPDGDPETLGGAGKLASGVPVTIEPGVYLPDRGGVRIEDTLVITEGGSELLTGSSRQLLVL